MQQNTTRPGNSIRHGSAALRRLDPAVVDHAIGNGVVVLGEQGRQVSAGRPADVIPQHRRLIVLDQFADMGGRVLHVVRGVRDCQEAVGGIGQQCVVVGPVVAARVVQPHPQSCGAHRTGEITDKVAAGVVAALVRMLQRGRPQAEALVVLGGQDDVTGAGGAAHLGDGVHVGRGGAVVEQWNEVVVGRIGAVRVTLVVPGGAALDAAGVEVPLGIGVVPQHLCGAFVLE